MTALSVGNAGSLVTRTIDQATSKDLMLRELFQNCLEATAKQTTGKKKIHIRITDPKWFGLQEYSSKKFGIVNTGPGMSATNIRRATDLSSCIAKIQGLHNNFGEGFKVACLPVNKSGLICVSCHNGEVHMVVLRKWADELTKEERYERRDFEYEDGTKTDVVNITPLFNDTATMVQAFGQFSNPSGLTTDEDWTYMILCGNDPNQDTTINPYGTGNQTPAWALNELYKRFAYIPSDVEVRSEIHSKGKTNTKSTFFKTVFDVLKEKSLKTPDKIQLETVSVPALASQSDVDEHVENGTINITYVWDGPYNSNDKNKDYPTSVISNNATCPLFSGLIYKDEIYDVRGGNVGTTTWIKPASECGITYGYRYCRVYVHIPASTDIVTDRYRTELLSNDHEKNKILFTDYKHVIRKYMPEWLKEKMSEYAPKPPNLGAVRQDLDDLLKKVLSSMNASKITTDTSGSAPVLKINVNPSNNRGGGRGSTNLGTSPGSALIPALLGKHKVPRPFPQIEVLTEKEIKGASVSPTFQYKAAEYALDSNILFINATYPAVGMIKEELLYGHTDITEDVETLAYDTSISLITKLVGTGLVYGLAKQGKPGYEDDFEKAIDPACLSTHADRWYDSIKEAKVSFGKDLLALELNSTIASKVA